MLFLLLGFFRTLGFLLLLLLVVRRRTAAIVFGPVLLAFIGRRDLALLRLVTL